jgi:conjugative relaxase-like TrwC/TraI family protein
VLNIGKLRRGGENYYLNSVAKGVEDYYLGSGEAPGYWLASGSEKLGLEGVVNELELKRVLRGLDPESGEGLVTSRKGQRVPGFDLTFRAPKSVALLHALGSKEASNEVVNAHDAAVAASIAYLEKMASNARRERNGRVSIASDGFIAAGFRHRTSRSGDPLLHTHVLTANMIRGTDGRWGALDARHLYTQAKTAGYLYQAHLRAELTRRLGVQFEEVHNGSADIAGVSREVIEAFSTRRKEIEEELGHQPASRAAAEVAALSTRKAKDYAVSPDELLPSWRDKARSMGLDEHALGDLIGHIEQRALGPSERSEIESILAGPSGLTRDNSTFTRREVIQALCDRLTQGATISEIEAWAEDFVSGAGAVALAGTAKDTAGPTVVPMTAREARYSTVEMLMTEREAIRSACGRISDGVGIAQETHVTGVIAGRTLYEEQRALVEEITTSGRGVEVVMGKAGTGKTFALGAAREAWESSGFRVIGCSLSARAALELEKGSGITSSTLTRLLMDIEAGEGFAARTVVVVDEAAMVGTRDIAALLAQAARDKAKVVLVGDDKQLPEIQAGGVFKGLRSRLPSIGLREVRRQPLGWEKETLDLLRLGKGSQTVGAYLDHGRITVSPEDEITRQRLVEEWWASRGRGETGIMVGARRSDVTDLNLRARSLMRAAGLIRDDLVVCGEDGFAVGDTVMMLRNDKRLGVLNGSRGEIVDFDEGAGELTIALDDGETVAVNARYVADGHMTYGYAITGHKAQGMTTDHSFVLADQTLYREWAYVAMSRGRSSNRMYVVAGDDRERREVGGEIEPVAYPLAEVSRALGRSHAKELALDVDDSLELSLEL